ncbi:MAG TPA: hypothetical protein VGX28_01430 [Frankiaceae bacterium]|jgi:hypothetical protein|nr:hypothetical protein [Frankiaceae bacterium]
MRFRLALACLVGALVAPAAHASPPIPPLPDLPSLLPGAVDVQDYCVYEVRADGTRHIVACAPAGRLPDLTWEIEDPPR